MTITKKAMTMQTIRYEQDVIAWANEQARLLRAGRFDLIDIEHIAEEIEDMGKSEARELENRIAVLLSHLLKWKYQPERQGGSWQRTLREQRRRVNGRLDDTPSLRGKLADSRWWRDVWADAVSQAADETGLGDQFPEECPWSQNEILSDGWFPT